MHHARFGWFRVVSIREGDVLAEPLQSCPSYWPDGCGKLWPCLVDRPHDEHAADWMRWRGSWADRISPISEMGDDHG